MHLLIGGDALDQLRVKLDEVLMLFEDNSPDLSRSSSGTSSRRRAAHLSGSDRVIAGNGEHLAQIECPRYISARSSTS